MQRKRERATQGRTKFEYSLLFFCLRLKLRKRDKCKERLEEIRGKVWYFNDPLRVISPENKGEWRMTEE